MAQGQPWLSGGCSCVSGLVLRNLMGVLGWAFLKDMKLEQSLDCKDNCEMFLFSFETTRSRNIVGNKLGNVITRSEFVTIRSDRRLGEPNREIWIG